MEIAIIASDRKKELMTEFCMAYQGILCKHNLYATESTGKYISDATGLTIECMLPGGSGGIEQLSSRISYNEIDLLLYFRNPLGAPQYNEAEHNLLRLCDIYTEKSVFAKKLLLFFRECDTICETGHIVWHILIHHYFLRS